MPSDLQITNIRDQANANSAITIASDGQITVNQNNPTLTLGSNATFPAKTVVGYEKNQTSITSSQTGTASYVDITGSSITYTPTTGSSFIVYECSFVLGGNNTQVSPLFGFRFLIDGSITKNNDSYSPFFQSNGTDLSHSREIHRMIYSASGWTSDKVVKMQFRVYQSGGNGGELHISRYDYLTGDGSVMGASDRLTDVDVTIYSVM